MAIWMIKDGPLAIGICPAFAIAPFPFAIV
jgi:hypothetical protein